MKLIAFLLALLLFMAIGFMVGFVLADSAHAKLLLKIANGDAFWVGNIKYRAVEVEK